MLNPYAEPPEFAFGPNVELAGITIALSRPLLLPHDWASVTIRGRIRLDDGPALARAAYDVVGRRPLTYQFGNGMAMIAGLDQWRGRSESWLSVSVKLVRVTQPRVAPPPAAQA